MGGVYYLGGQLLEWLGPTVQGWFFICTSVVIGVVLVCTARQELCDTKDPHWRSSVCVVGVVVVLGVLFMCLGVSLVLHPEWRHSTPAPPRYYYPQGPSGRSP
jgi:hypothetical protein